MQEHEHRPTPGQRSTEEHGSGTIEDPGGSLAQSGLPDRPEGAGTGGPGTPEGHTAEAPRADELGTLGTPGAGLTPAAPHAADADEMGIAPADETARGASDHADGHDTTAAGAEHPHEEIARGPIEWRAWGYSALGVAIGALVAAAFYVATMGRQ